MIDEHPGFWYDDGRSWGDILAADSLERKARTLCNERHRNPDREMKGPYGTFPAWKAYTGG